MTEDAQPDLRHAQAWLREMRSDLLAAREQARLANGWWRPAVLALANFANLAEKHATTLGDIIARADIVARDRVELPTVEQANALARRGASVKRIAHRPFDLPADYLLVEYEDGFTCGIAPNGDVSS